MKNSLYAVDGAAMQRVYNGEETRRAKMKWAREGFPETTEPQNSPSHEEEKEDGSSEEEEDGSSQPQDIHGHVEETPPLKQKKIAICLTVVTSTKTIHIHTSRWWM